MSTRFTVYCQTCEEVGPHIRRHHNGALLLAGDVPRFFHTVEPDKASDDWGAFLLKHEYHELELLTEWRARTPAPVKKRGPAVTLDEFARGAEPA